VSISPALLSSNMEHWLTPPAFLRLVLRVLGYIDQDPATNRGSVVPANDPYYAGERNGLLVSWKGKVYCNPPYGTEIMLWIRRMIEYAGDMRMAELIALLPARVDTEWGQRVLASADAWCMWFGRITFWRVWDPDAEIAKLKAKERRDPKLKPFLELVEAMRGGQYPGDFRLNENGLWVGPELNRKTCQPQPAPFPSLVPYWGDDVRRFTNEYQPYGTITVRRGENRGIYPCTNPRLAA
jgi:hypothetical protein